MQQKRAIERVLRRVSIKKRMFLMFLALSVVPTVILGAVAYAMTASHIEHKVQSYCVEMNRGFQAGFDQVFQKMGQDSISIIYDREVQRKINRLHSQPRGENTYYSALTALREELTTRIVLNDAITRANIIFDYASPCTYSRYEMWNYEYLNAKEQQLMKQARREKGGLIWNSLSELYSGDAAIMPYLDRHYPILQTARQFSMVSKGVSIGTITLWYNDIPLDDLCEKMDISGQFYILDDRLNVVYSNQKQQMHQPFDRQTLLSAKPQEENNVWRLAGQDAIMTASPSEVNDFWYVHIQPYSVLVAENLKFAGVMVLLGVFLIMASGIAASVFAISIRQPLTQISKYLNTVVSENCFEMQLFDAGADEVHTLSTEVNDVVQRLGRLVEENYAIQLRENQFRLMALKAQINPHFLFNTIDSIRWTARQNEDFEVSKRLEMLSTLLRNVLRDDKLLVSFAQEIGNTKNYLALQQNSLRERIRVSWDVDAAVLPCMTLLLLLQPLVENAIFHGMKPEEPLHLSICVKERGQWIQVEVCDDGCGITPERLQDVMSREYGGENIGLYNVRSRVETYFPTSKFQVISAPGAGTKVEITLPKEEGPDNVDTVGGGR